MNRIGRFSSPLIVIMICFCFIESRAEAIEVKRPTWSCPAGFLCNPVEVTCPQRFPTGTVTHDVRGDFWNHGADSDNHHHNCFPICHCGPLPGPTLTCGAVGLHGNMNCDVGPNSGNGSIKLEPPFHIALPIGDNREDQLCRDYVDSNRVDLDAQCEVTCMENSPAPLTCFELTPFDGQCVPDAANIGCAISPWQ
jgi:hypothetical protein